MNDLIAGRYQVGACPPCSEAHLLRPRGIGRGYPIMYSITVPACYTYIILLHPVLAPFYASQPCGLLLLGMLSSFPSHTLYVPIFLA